MYSLICCSGVGVGQANEHLASLGAVVLDALVGSGAAVESIAGVENGLAVISGEGHFAADDVVNGLHRVVAELAAAAGEKMGQANNKLAVIDVFGIMETSGEHVVVTGSFISISVGLAYDFVAHGKTSFLLIRYGHRPNLQNTY